MRTAEEYANKMTWCFSHGSPAYHEMKKIINEARVSLLSEIRYKVVENRNEAHVNCLEEAKQAFNLVINIIENFKTEQVK